MSTDPNFVAAPAAAGAADQGDEEDLLKCRICTNEYHFDQSKSAGEGDNSSSDDPHDRSPVTLTCCGNTVCYDCAERHRAARASELKGNRKRIGCMICRELYHSENDSPYLRGKIAVDLSYLSSRKRQKVCEDGGSSSETYVEAAESARRLFSSVGEKSEAAKARQQDAEKEKEETGNALRRAMTAHEEAQHECEVAREAVLAAKEELKAAKEGLRAAKEMLCGAEKSLERTTLTLEKERDSDDRSSAKLEQAKNEVREAVAKVEKLRDTLKDFVEFGFGCKTDPVRLEREDRTVKHEETSDDRPITEPACADAAKVKTEETSRGIAELGSNKRTDRLSKHEGAELLCKHIAQIRASYSEDLRAKDSKTRQLATATWIIDRLGLYTFMCFGKPIGEGAEDLSFCSLCVADVEFQRGDKGKHVIEFRFLGANSDKFPLTINFSAAIYNDDNGMGKQVHKNLRKFCKGKEPTEQVFDALSSLVLDEYLESFLKGLAAMVFLAYNSSKALQDTLSDIEEDQMWKTLTSEEKMVKYRNAIQKVEAAYDHRKYANNAMETGLKNTRMECMSEKLNTLQDEKVALVEVREILKSGGTIDEIAKDAKKVAAMRMAYSTTEMAKTMKAHAKASMGEENTVTFATQENAGTKHNFIHAKLCDEVPTKGQIHTRMRDLSVQIKEMKTAWEKGQWERCSDARIKVAWCKRNEVPIKEVIDWKERRESRRPKRIMAISSNWKFGVNN